jgi:hypothetical protein
LTEVEAATLALRYRRALERKHGRGVVRFPGLAPVFKLAATV